MMKRLWSSLRRAFAGGRLMSAIERNEKAADELDKLLRKVLNQ